MACLLVQDHLNIEQYLLSLEVNLHSVVTIVNLHALIGWHLQDTSMLC